MSQLRLFAELEAKSWPEEIVESLKGRMTVIEQGPERLYCVRDWVYTVSGSTSQNRNNPLNDLKRALQKRGEWTRIYETFIEAPNPDANQRQMAFATDVGLYEVTIRLDDRAEAVRCVKCQMARSLAFQDWARRHPDQASTFFAEFAARSNAQFSSKSRDYYRLLNEGFAPLEADQLLRERAKLKEVFKEAAATWQQRGAQPTDFPRLVNVWSLVLKGKTATEIKRELGCSDTPWNCDSALELVLNQIVAIVARGLHDRRQSQGFEELARDLRDTKPTLVNVRETLAEQFSAKRRQPRLKLPDQLNLPSGEDRGCKHG